MSVLILFYLFLLCSNTCSHVSSNMWCGVDMKLHWCHFCCASCCIGWFDTFDLERREVSAMLYWVQPVKMTQQSLSVLCAIIMCKQASKVFQGPNVQYKINDAKLNLIVHTWHNKGRAVFLTVEAVQSQYLQVSRHFDPDEAPKDKSLFLYGQCALV